MPTARMTTAVQYHVDARTNAAASVNLSAGAAAYGVRPYRSISTGIVSRSKLRP